MSCKSAFGYLISNDEVKYATCQWDGYPEHMIPELKKYWNTSSEAMELINNKEMEELNEGVAIIYNDVDDDHLEKYIITLEEFKNLEDVEYFYLFEDDKWLVLDKHTSTEFEDIDNVILESNEFIEVYNKIITENRK